MTVELTKILTNYAVFAVVWYILQTFGYFKTLKKTSMNLLFAFIPIVREVIMFRLVWKNKNIGLIWFVTAIGGLAMFLISSNTGIQALGWAGLSLMIVGIVLQVLRAFKQAKAFNVGGGLTTLLIIANPLGNISLGMSQAEYKGVM